MIKITIYRHGQTNWNVKGLTQGHSDNPLNLTGLAQAFEIGKILENQKIDLILSSDLSRASQTARVATKKHSADIPFVLSSKLRERCFGFYDAKHSDIFIAECQHLIDQWNSVTAESFDAKIKGVESQREIINRFLQCLEDNINNYPLSRNIVVFSHGGVMKDLYKYLKNEIRCFKNCESLELYYDLTEKKLKIIE